MQSRLRGTLSNLGREALQIVLPSWCVACDSSLPWKERKASCCRICWDSLPKIEGAKCASCARPLAGLASGVRRPGLQAESPGSLTPNAIPTATTSTPGTAPPGLQAESPGSLKPDAIQIDTGTDNRQLTTPLCLSCHQHPLPLDWCDAWGEYAGPLERLLQALKFERHDFLDDALASLLEQTLRARGDLVFDAIVPVPMQRSRERRRGYNQAELLGRALGRRVAIPCDISLLRRAPGERATQSTLPKRKRAENVRAAFTAGEVSGKALLLVDDICTTGETLRACARTLLAGGAARVCAIAVAKAS